MSLIEMMICQSIRASFNIRESVYVQLGVLVITNMVDQLKSYVAGVANRQFHSTYPSFYQLFQQLI